MAFRVLLCAYDVETSQRAETGTRGDTGNHKSNATSILQKTSKTRHSLHFIVRWRSCLSTCIERVSYFYVFNKARPLIDWKS